MNTIRSIGQAITSTNYATNRLFNFNPDKIRNMAQDFLASGISEVEIPEGVLDPEGRCPEKFVDEKTLNETISMLPSETKVLATYVSSGKVGKDNAEFLKATKIKFDHLLRFFPDMTRAMLHPPGNITDGEVEDVVSTWAELARYAAEKRPGFQCCLHNHYDGSCESASQVRRYLDALATEDEPALRWGPDTGHCHGMQDEFLTVLDEYAPLIGNHFHIKARIPGFDSQHGGEAYTPERDIWKSEAEKGRGLYSGFVNCADPEIETPFKEIFSIIQKKAQPTEKAITGAIEIDNPRQHPRLEAMCSTLYLKTVHGIEPAIKLSNDDIINRVFKTEGTCGC